MNTTTSLIKTFLRKPISGFLDGYNEYFMNAEEGYVRSFRIDLCKELEPNLLNSIAWILKRSENYFIPDWEDKLDLTLIEQTNDDLQKLILNAKSLVNFTEYVDNPHELPVESNLNDVKNIKTIQWLPFIEQGTADLMIWETERRVWYLELRYIS